MVDCSNALEQCPIKDYDKVAEYIAQISYKSKRFAYALHAARYSKLDLSTKSRKAKKTQRARNSNDRLLSQ